MYPAPEGLIKRIRSEIDPAFVPLWCNKWWQSPNGGLVKTGYHIIARHVPHPRHRAPVVRNLVLPTNRTYGINYENPILLCLSMDGLSDDERNRGCLPRYEPFTGDTFRAMKKAMWTRNNKRPDETVDEWVNSEKEREAKVWKSVSDEADYRHQHDGVQFRKGTGAADRVYVSDTLIKLRDIAGSAA